MKYLLHSLAILILSSASLCAQGSMDSEVAAVTSSTFTVEIVHLKSDEGQLQIGLYDSEDNWLGNPFKGQTAKIKDGKATVTFTEVPYGTYAVSVVHDEDMNNELNTGAFGIPSEPYASSRGAKGRFGPPKWEDAKFNVATPTASETIKF